MIKFFIPLCAVLITASTTYAQRTGGPDPVPGRNQGGGQGRTVSLPVEVIRESGLPLTKEKLDALESDAKIFQAANLPLEALVQLKLTSDQKKSLTGMADTMQSKMREMMRNGDREGATALREEFAKNASNILTADQKKIIAKYPSRNSGGNRGGRGQGGGRPGGPGNPPANF